jgi:hypothetical protein
MGRHVSVTFHEVDNLNAVDHLVDATQMAWEKSVTISRTAQVHDHRKGTLYRPPTMVRPYERMSYVRALASLAISSSQGPDKRPRWVPPIM